MRFLSILIVAALLPLMGCSQNAALKKKLGYVEAPSTQAEKDRNAIIDYAIANKLDVDVTESGIFYVMETEGEGAQPNADDIVTVHYEGTLIDSAGTKFDSSYDRSEPTTFPLGNLIKGWQEAIPMLKPGGKGVFLIPSELAYGPAGAGGSIPPNSVLKFKIELVSVFDKAAQTAKDEELIKGALGEELAAFTRTEDGIYYRITKAGNGALPTMEDKVRLNYEGRLLDGVVLGSTFAEGGQPVTFPVSRVRELQKPLLLLPVGGRGTFYIPSALAYGPTPPPGSPIAPNAILVFDLEVLEIVK